MKNTWLQIGCFLTGYNYDILMGCSEVPRKDVKRYTAALLIISIIWAFVGYNFSSRYMSTSLIASLFASILAVVIIIQIERQIILSVHKNKMLFVVRTIIATMMALIGSLIVDQIIFKEDIEQEQLKLLSEKVDLIYPAKAAEYNRQIKEYDLLIAKSEAQKNQLQNDINRNPILSIKNVDSKPLTIKESVTNTDGSIKTNDKIVNARTVTTTNMNNPKIQMLTDVNSGMIKLIEKRDDLNKKLPELRDNVEKDIKSHVGFIDELKVMYKLLAGSNIALVVWLIWVIFLFALELLIVITKYGEVETDYHALIKHQEQLHRKKIELMNKGNI
jgi:hypothetical protein